MRKIIFNWYLALGNTEREVVEFKDDTTEEEIEKAFDDWVWDRIGSDFWREEEK
ncbi:hypothetical protein [Paenibacillus chitinolyticus]|uniref:Uncharacterized protein n=1 Tax=Paenibacillus chitinolyticus TaxID=79263 RepID=A0ABT4FME1_9BACL|nr:hypothetical protein [Paenibacillus chitinolyticus]MCY9593738.1 hypothetical protein [Paenibacillus chitinolyticus]MCY9599697.1 hypothetical protein [Paenibacillus chitinolyticus]